MVLYNAQHSCEPEVPAGGEAGVSSRVPRLAPQSRPHAATGWIQPLSDGSIVIMPTSWPCFLLYFPPLPSPNTHTHTHTLSQWGWPGQAAL